MKRFAFPLERALGLRRQQVQIEEIKLEAILGDRRKIEQEREDLEASAKKAMSGILRKRILETAELDALYGFRMWSTKQGGILAQQLAECDKRLADQRCRIAEARQRQRLIEKLRERRLAEWDAAFQRELEEQAAESFVARWNRQRALGNAVHSEERGTT